MPSKVYSTVEKEEIKEKLISIAQRKYAKYGIRNVRLDDILKEVGISKPFFYKLFVSVPSLVMNVLHYQWELMYDRIYKLADSDLEWDSQVRYFIDQLVHHYDSGILVMTQDEETWIKKHVPNDVYTNFMETQIKFFELLIKIWDINIECCDPKVFANLLITLALINNSASQSLPFIYIDSIEATTNAQVESLMFYLKSIRI